jgi:hypothetical protein
VTNRSGKPDEQRDEQVVVVKSWWSNRGGQIVVVKSWWSNRGSQIMLTVSVSGLYLTSLSIRFLS